MTIELSVACGRRDLNRALLDGSVDIEGVDAHTMAVFPSNRHRRFFRHQEFDVSEASLATLLAIQSEPEKYPFTAIPVFPQKKFRHSYFYKRKDADIDGPADLAGRKVGISSWQTTANVWMRGIAQDHYGLDLETVHWYRRKDDDADMVVPDRFDVHEISRQEGLSVGDRANLRKAFLDGDVDAVMDPSTSLFETVVESDALEFMFDDPLAEEKRYFEETGIHPPMHAVAIRDEVLEEHPWVAVNVFDAFCESRDRALDSSKTWGGSLTWSHLHRAEQDEVLGNTWEYGLTNVNRRALEKLIEYAHDQGLIPREYVVEELFAESTVNEMDT